MFKSLRIEHWRQIDNLDIEFHDNLTILTGANGAGKTTILNLLSNLFGWSSSFISLPYKKKGGLLKYLSDVWPFVDKLKKQEANQSNTDTIGRITYHDGIQTEIRVPSDVGHNYNVQYTNQKQIKGLFIPSHRMAYTYRQVTSIPTVPKTKDQIYTEYRNMLHNSYYSTVNQRPNHIIKESLISLATFGLGNDVVSPNEHLWQMFENFEQILRIVLPPKIGFEKIQVRLPEVILATQSGEFSLDAVSGGIASIIDIAWQIFIYPSNNERYVVTFDEPENHLHPEMQKTLMRNLIRAFPNTQFIIATHNPFIITSDPDSNVYVLNYNKDNKVYSERLDMVNKAGTSNEILRDVLGVSVTFPLWVEEKLQDIVRKYSTLEFNHNNLAELRREMGDIGLDNLIPTTISSVLEEGQKHDKAK